MLGFTYINPNPNDNMQVLLGEEAPLLPMLNAKQKHPFYYSTTYICNRVKRFLPDNLQQWVVVILPSLLGCKHLRDSLKLKISARAIVNRSSMSHIFRSAASVAWAHNPGTFVVELSVDTTYRCLFVETNNVQQSLMFSTTDTQTIVGLSFRNLRKNVKIELQRELRLDDALHLEVRDTQHQSLHLNVPHKLGALFGSLKTVTSRGDEGSAKFDVGTGEASVVCRVANGRCPRFSGRVYHELVHETALHVVPFGSTSGLRIGNLFQRSGFFTVRYGQRVRDNVYRHARFGIPLILTRTP